MKNSLNLCVIGFGNEGKAFCKLLDKKHDEIISEYGIDIKITAIITKTKGSLLNLDGINIREAVECLKTKETFENCHKDSVVGDNLAVMKQSNADVLIEMSSMAINDGQPAITYIENAFKNKMHVITANKGPLAWAYAKLNALAKANNCQFLYEATVLDGTPVFNLVKNTLPGCKILGFKGVLNSTTNFILEEMENGHNFEDALEDAKKLGFAEADSTMDTEGWDCATKICALINVLMDGNITPPEIKREGIKNITYYDLDKAKRDGCRIKLLCEGTVHDGKASGTVRLTRVSNKDIFSNVNATISMLCLKTDIMGKIYIAGKDPEVKQKAYGIYSDLLTLIKNLQLKSI